MKNNINGVAAQPVDASRSLGWWVSIVLVCFHTFMVACGPSNTHTKDYKTLVKEWEKDRRLFQNGDTIEIDVVGDYYLKQGGGYLPLKQNHVDAFIKDANWSIPTGALLEDKRLSASANPVVWTQYVNQTMNIAHSAEGFTIEFALRLKVVDAPSLAKSKPSGDMEYAELEVELPVLHEFCNRAQLTVERVNSHSLLSNDIGDELWLRSDGYGYVHKIDKGVCDKNRQCGFFNAPNQLMRDMFRAQKR